MFHESDKTFFLSKVKKKHQKISLQPKTPISYSNGHVVHKLVKMHLIQIYKNEAKKKTFFRE